MRRWQSIAVRLPLLVSTLLVMTLGISIVQAYRHVEDVVFDSAADRLAGAAGQVATIVANGQAASRTGAEVAAADPRLRAFLREPNPSLRAEVLEVLDGVVAQAPATIAVELLTLGGTSLALAERPASAGLARTTPALSEGITSLRAENGLILYELVVPVPESAADATPAGWMVLHRVFLAAGIAQVLASFVGEDAVFYLTNRDGSLWTDLSQPVEGPAIVGPPLEGFQRYQASDTLRVAAAAVAVPGTPWLAWAEVSEATITPPIEAFLRQRFATAVVLLLIAALGAWFLTRRFALAVVRLDEATRGIASGDYSRRVAVGRTDEIGTLSQSFNAMAQTIEDQRAGLEEQVRDRTAKLRNAYRELVDAQQELVRKEKLATLGQLASGVGHELRNPLGVMTNAVYYLELVLRDAPATVVEYLGILRSQIGLSEKIVGDLLDFSRVKTPMVEVVSVRDLVDAQLARLGPTPSGVTIETAIPEDTPAVHVDPIQIGQVLLNLLMNGIQAMEPKGGTLRISARPAGPGQVAISVSDEGTGISPQVRAKIFEPLFTTKARGIGLGLAVSRSLVEKNGGTVTFESSPGEGTTFTVTLPTQPREAAA